MSKSGAIALAIAIPAVIVAIGAAYRFTDIGKVLHLVPAPAKDSAEQLANEATDALEKVKNRKLGSTLRPPKYDDILGPLDKLLRQARETLRSPSYDPLADYETIRSFVEPVINLAQRAHEQAQTETSFLKKDYRFMEQKGEACQYLATAIWNRLEAEYDQKPSKNGQAFIPSPADSERLYNILDAGIDADPDNKHVWYLEAVVAKANGSFALAEKNLRKALELDGDFIAAWNDLGLVMINLKRFDDAERALTKAKEKAGEAYRRAGVPPGPEYTTALFNLARVHQALVTYYQRAVRTDDTRENRAELARHEEAADANVRELLAILPPDSPMAKEIKTPTQ